MGQPVSKIDGRFVEIQKFGKKVARQGVGQVRTVMDKFETLRARRDPSNEFAFAAPKSSSMGGAIGKTLLAGVGIAAIVGTTVAITKFSSQILSSVGHLGTHGGIVVGVFVGIAFLASGIISAVAIAQKHRQVRDLSYQLAHASAEAEDAFDVAGRLKEEVQTLEKEKTSLKISLSGQSATAQTHRQAYETLAQTQREQAAPAMQTRVGFFSQPSVENFDDVASFEAVAMAGR